MCTDWTNTQALFSLLQKKSTLVVTNYHMNHLSANKLDAILQKCKNYLCHRSNVMDLWFSCPIILYYLIEILSYRIIYQKNCCKK